MDNTTSPNSTTPNPSPPTTGAKRNTPLRRIAFTINNPSSTRLEELKAIPWIRYGIAAREKGEKGTPHLQCCATFSKQVRFNTVRAAIPGAHIEAMRCSTADNIRYCKKDGDFEEWGDIPKPGMFFSFFVLYSFVNLNRQTDRPNDCSAAYTNGRLSSRHGQ